MSRTLQFELKFYFIYTYLLYDPKTSLIWLFLWNYIFFVKYEIKVDRGKCKFGFGVNVNIYNKYNLKYYGLPNYYFSTPGCAIISKKTSGTEYTLKDAEKAVATKKKGNKM